MKIKLLILIVLLAIASLVAVAAVQFVFRTSACQACRSVIELFWRPSDYFQAILDFDAECNISKEVSVVAKYPGTHVISTTESPGEEFRMHVDCKSEESGFSAVASADQASRHYHADGVTYIVFWLSGERALDSSPMRCEITVQCDRNAIDSYVFQVYKISDL
jgi:hypothetical protein